MKKINVEDQEIEIQILTLQEPEPVKVLKQLEIINGEERQAYKVIEIKPK